MKVFMSYARPLSWMALKFLVKLLKHMLALIVGFVIASPLLFLMFWIQDVFEVRF